MGNSGCICSKKTTSDQLSDVPVASQLKCKSAKNLPSYSQTVLKPSFDFSETKEQSFANPRYLIKNNFSIVNQEYQSLVSR